MRNQAYMKTRNRFSLVMAIVLGLFLMSCDNDGDIERETAQEIAFRILGDSPWTLGNGSGSIVVDGTDVSANYEGFSLAYGEGTYSTTNADELFRASGTWD